MSKSMRATDSAWIVLGFILLGAQVGLGQNLPMGAGYSSPSAVVRGAPGQVITLFVRNIQTRLTEPVVASSLPLPTNLRGVSVTMNQTANPQTVAVPLFAIFQIDSCQGLTSEACIITGITVQIPFELVAPIPGAVPATQNVATLVVSEDGTPGDPLVLVPLVNQIHVVDLCDTTSFSPNSLPCPAPAVTHGDGSVVTGSNPARGGETLVLYSFGLGRTNPPTGSGMPTPSPPPIAAGSLNLDFSVNAPPRFPVGDQLEQPLFIGLTPGLVGLYQVNFKLPPVPPEISSCGGSILSNLTITLVGSTSFDGARLCVVP
jgi:uncharacterized protein (TIGR03437 family)